MPVGRNDQALLFRRAIDVGRNDLAVPVNEFRRIRVVEQIDRDRHAFAQADQRSRDLAVVADGADGVILRDVGQHRRDAQRYVGGSGRHRNRLRPECRGAVERLQPASARPLPVAASSQKVHAGRVCMSIALTAYRQT